ncbi:MULTISPECIES: bifunctional phosphopantothenoylcysteine decarboxylase/phosphopantothenate--cysteine ligase CoaBC [unclassified Polaromonas]|jgi:phosphopantothenoylcysteine decarboxylase/phosphopantothenate--cysteine ligase|uniref:bifunctional phosphopantothenoylcysteine decarboxylase/phosphopantothenate--cysteine ligase CoaBC n=1 Tax=unclassified Polaromonas TaxID=2638319 RepID=UPI000BDBF1E5|nr:MULTISPECIES: bifunctional phosphopantothenoylcysteine decarboxylase/phosphopantothenate--cysteine ligase CoaBC [unclassified Polaromonas]OYY37841.1 MAG: phosphopantothenate synthase [Polaromonas sp. 35-63-35]OYZ18013.1 MAG: phosphopantothenate synthase [Polaromonas sp. 16-63-31]OYZ79392.1 MAG: phosphopantothenate synthase [Polaromonas sp. 24-63-21]OZA50534.1 MAG: phosphopantothenate synthase [Polaromonas sp. 17-63-33]OZA85196.1 MAG: phosphopantothenate synthase [Polaromonas sp. 39-63-25]
MTKQANEEAIEAGGDLAGRHIVLGLSGGIACYKAAELCRALIKQGATVQVVMTEAAEQFITAVTLQALSGRPVYTSQWDSREANNMAHINLSREADAILIAPCSADFMAKLLHGRADDLLSLMCLARPIATVPLLIAPAMNREMWAHPATQRNMAQLSSDGATILGVGSGFQACGETGDGRMLEPPELLEDMVAFFTPKVLAGQHVLVTAGPTYEAIDPVRGITNLSSGKMGFAVARAAHEAGAQVTLVAGPVSLSTPRGVTRIDVRSAQNMLEAVTERAQAATVFIATAAVADWRPASSAERKIKKDGSGQAPQLAFTENPDILATLAQSPRGVSGELFCVGFAAESHDLEDNAQAKRLRKGVPLLVGNIGPATFGRDDNALLLVDAQGSRELARASKLSLARQLVAEIASRIKRAG